MEAWTCKKKVMNRLQTFERLKKDSAVVLGGPVTNEEVFGRGRDYGTPLK